MRSLESDVDVGCLRHFVGPRGVHFPTIRRAHRVAIGGGSKKGLKRCEFGRIPSPRSDPSDGSDPNPEGSGSPEGAVFTECLGSSWQERSVLKQRLSLQGGPNSWGDVEHVDMTWRPTTCPKQKATCVEEICFHVGTTCFIMLLV